VIVGGIAHRLRSTPQRSGQRSKTAVLGGERVLALVVDRENGVVRWDASAIPPFFLKTRSSWSSD
jgi:hypothetical protein